MRALLASPLGFLVGLSLGALGGGGSILAVPALVYVAGQHPKAATTTSLVVVGLVAVFGSLPHRRAGHVRLREGLAFGAAGLGGSILGSALNTTVDADTLLLAFSGVMFAAAWAMRRRSRTAGAAGATSPESVPVATRVRVDTGTVARVVAAGTAVGLLTGFFGVGGGFVIVPALVLVLHFPMPEAVGTSLLVIAVNSAAALVARTGGGSFEWRVILPFVCSGLAGVLAGSRAASRVPAGRLAGWFSALLMVVATYTALESSAALW